MAVDVTLAGSRRRKLVEAEVNGTGTDLLGTISKCMSFHFKKAI
jgi:hypothetical protein